MEQDIATQIVGLGGASDFSLWSLFLRADICRKFVSFYFYLEVQFFLSF